MRELICAGAGVLGLAFAGATGAIGAAQAAGGGQTPGPALDRLIERFNAGAPAQNGVVVEGWVEQGAASAELVVKIEPQGEVKLIADPGITVTPRARPGVAWLTELPYRRVDPTTEYFSPPATVRLPFSAADDEPVELLVEYAYCVVDFQCFFGEETLIVATVP